MSTIVSSPAGSTAPNIDGLINHLRRDNPTAKITSVPFASDNSQTPAQRLQLVVSASKLKLTPAVLVANSVEKLDINRSGANAVVTFTVNALPS